MDGAVPGWQRTLDGPIREQLAYVDGHVVVAAEERVYGLDAGSGETAWTLDPPASPQGEHERLDATIRVHQGVVYALLGVGFGVGGSDYTLVALDPDGTERWRYGSDLARYHEIAGFGDDMVVLPTHDDALSPDGEQVIAVDLADGAERWRAPSGDAYTGAVGDGVATIEAAGLALDCFDLDTGDRRFRFEPDGDASVDSSAIGRGHVFAAAPGYDGDEPSLYAFDPADGDEVWSDGSATTTMVRYLDDLYVGGSALRRLGPDGTEQWRYEPGGFVTGVPVDERTMYTNARSRVVAIRRGDGSERWGIDVTERTHPVARGGDSIVAMDGEAGVTVALSAADGGERWRASLPREYEPRPATSEDAAYLATEEGAVLSLPL